MHTRGYMVLTLVFIVSAVALALGLSLKLQSIAETDTIRRVQSATSNFVAAHTCLEEALRRQKLGISPAGTLTLGASDCTITAPVIPFPSITVVAARESLIKRLQAVTFLTKYRMFLSWQELP